jgi:hypothetical protein
MNPPKKQNMKDGNPPSMQRHDPKPLAKRTVAEDTVPAGTSGGEGLPGWLTTLELLGTAVFLGEIASGWRLLAGLTLGLLVVVCLGYHVRRATWITPRVRNLASFAVVASVMVVLPLVAGRVGGA